MCYAPQNQPHTHTHTHRERITKVFKANCGTKDNHPSIKPISMFFHLDQFYLPLICKIYILLLLVLLLPNGLMASPSPPNEKQNEKKNVSIFTVRYFVFLFFLIIFDSAWFILLYVCVCLLQNHWAVKNYIIN